MSPGRLPNSSGRLLPAQLAWLDEQVRLSSYGEYWCDPCLIRRFRPDNRYAVINALPFIVRLLGRRDHIEIERSLRAVLLSDGGDDALARGTGFATAVRRRMYELLTGGIAIHRRVLDAALGDPDAVIRARAIRSVATDDGFEHRAAILERLLRDDPLRRIDVLLNSLASRMPEETVKVLRFSIKPL